jgi:hypothetical protein
VLRQPVKTIAMAMLSPVFLTQNHDHSFSIREVIHLWTLT